MQKIDEEFLENSIAGGAGQNAALKSRLYDAQCETVKTSVPFRELEIDGGIKIMCNIDESVIASEHAQEVCRNVPCGATLHI